MRRFKYLFPLLITCMFLSFCKKKDNTQAPPEPAPLPQLSTSPVTAVTDGDAIGGGAVISEGTSPILEAGICWDSLPGPAINKGTKVKATGAGNYTCTISGLKPYTIYYVRAYATNANGTSYGSELSFISRDVWAKQSVSSTTPTIYCMKSDGNKVYIGSDKGLFYSPNGGDTWQAAGISNTAVGAIGVNNNVVFAASANTIYKSDDNGFNFTKVSSGVNSIPYVYDFSINGNYVYASGYNGIYISSNNGSNWSNVNPSPTFTLQFMQLAKGNNVVYSSSGDNFLYKSTDNGLSWPTTNTVNVQASGNIATLGNKVFMSSMSGLFSSGDQGTSWTLNNSLPTHYGYLSASDSSLFYCIPQTREFYLSTNGGETWTSLTKLGYTPLTLTIDAVFICPKAIFIYRGSSLYRLRR